MHNHESNEDVLKKLVGKTIKQITGLEKESVKVCIATECGLNILFYHEQDCCEYVELLDYEADVEDLIGALVVSAEEIDQDSGYIKARNTIGSDLTPACSNSYTYTFYKIETNKGGIWMRWLGESNGYYSEDVTVSSIQRGE